MSDRLVSSQTVDGTTSLDVRQIRGRVVAADTGRPLRRARVLVTPSAPIVAVSTVPLGNGQPRIPTPNSTRTAVTDTDGRYSVSDLPPGRYTISASRNGYVTTGYGQRRVGEPGTIVDLTTIASIDRLDLALPRLSDITGHVLDETGDALAGARVFLLQSSYLDGLQRWAVASGGATTDATGAYRLIGVLPGTHVLMATLAQTWTVIEGDREQTIGYAPTYFPGTTDLASARRVVVSVGQRITNVDWTMARGTPATVTGTVVNSHFEPLGGQTVYVAQEFQHARERGTRDIANSVIGADGRFRLEHLPPGEYRFMVRDVEGNGPDAHVAEAAAIPVILNGEDLDGLAIVTSAGWSARGTISTENSSVPSAPAGAIRVGAILVNAATDPRTGGASEDDGQMQEDGSFSIARVFGPARLRVRTPNGWMIKAVLHDGRDVTDTPIEAKSGEIVDRIQIVVTDRVTTVTGAITDDKGAPLSDATVLVFATERERWAEDSRFVRTVRPDQTAQYQISGLPAGEYLAVALPSIPLGQWNDPGYLESLRSIATRVSVPDGGSQVVPLTIRRVQ